MRNAAELIKWVTGLLTKIHRFPNRRLSILNETNIQVGLIFFLLQLVCREGERWAAALARLVQLI